MAAELGFSTAMQMDDTGGGQDVASNTPRRRTATGATAGSSPPARRLLPSAAAGTQEHEIVGVLTDHAERLDRIWEIVRTFRSKATATLGAHEAKLAVYEENDTMLKDKLCKLEAQLNEDCGGLLGRMEAVANIVDSNDTQLKENLRVLEARVGATASAEGTSGDAPRAASLEDMAQINSRIELCEQQVILVDAKHQRQGEELLQHANARLAALEGWTRNIRAENMPAPPGIQPQTGTARPAFPTTQGHGSQFLGTSPSPALPGGESTARFPRFNRDSYASAPAVAAPVYQIGSTKPLFDDKVAISQDMKYSEDNKREWMKTTTNYLISKAYEMKYFLPWAESAQAQVITEAHVDALRSTEYCSDHDPAKLSRDLWGYLNLCLTGNKKNAFNNVESGNGFEAWRQVVVPIAPRSEARLHGMHRRVNNPAAVNKLSEVSPAIIRWEGELKDYYKSGGDVMPDRTKIINAMGMLPPTTPGSLKLALKGMTDFEAFKEELDEQIRFLEDFGAPTRHAQVVEGREDSSSAPGPQGDLGQEQVTENDLPIFLTAGLSQDEKDDMVLAINIRRQGQGRGGAPGRAAGRPRTPPRDARDVKCANCGELGHDARICKKAQVPREERKCHKCGKPGHIAKDCRSKMQPKIAVAESALPSPTTRAFEGNPKTIFCVTDAEGFTGVKPRKSKAVTFADIPVVNRVKQGERKKDAMGSNRYSALADAEKGENSQRQGREHPENEKEDDDKNTDFPALSGGSLARQVSSKGTSTKVVSSGTDINTADIRRPESVSALEWKLVDKAIKENEKRAQEVARQEGAKTVPATQGASFEAADEMSRLRVALSSARTTEDRLRILAGLEAPSAPMAPSTGHGFPMAPSTGHGFPMAGTSSNGSCTSFTHEPNVNCAPRGALPKGMMPARFGIETGEGPRPTDGFKQVMQAMVMTEAAGRDDELLLADWVDVDVEVALDSGCCDHVMDTEVSAPGYEVFESEGSRRGAGFLVGNGARIPNEGEVHLNFQVPGADGDVNSVGSTFQASPVSRPLMSVSRICKNGFKCTFDDQEAQIIDKDGKVQCVFKRSGGLYVCNMRLKAPSPFHRPE
jgi:hypothetical protein